MPVIELRGGPLDGQYRKITETTYQHGMAEFPLPLRDRMPAMDEPFCRTCLYRKVPYTHPVHREGSWYEWEFQG